MNDGLDDKTRDKIIRVLTALFPDAKIYLFGSRAQGKFGSRSDIDIAIMANRELPREDIDEAKSMLRESNISLWIDIVDFHGVSKLMQEQILKYGVIWKN